MDARQKLTEVVQRGKEAEVALERLQLLDEAATTDDLKVLQEATALVESLGDTAAAGRLKARRLQLMAKGV